MQTVKIKLGERKRATVGEIDAIINAYLTQGGEAYTIREGVLGHGLMVLIAPGLKTIVVREYALNGWSSVHQVSIWSKIPKKYQAMIDNL